MRSSEFKLNDLLILKDLNTNTNMLVCCWPSPLVDLSQISLNKTYLALNSIQNDQSLICYRLNNKVPRIVNNLSLECMTTNFDINKDADLVLAYLKEIYLNKYIQIKQPMFIFYMGNQLIFKIIDIKPKNNQIDEQIDLSSSFDNMMNLNENKHLKIETNLINEIFQINMNSQISLNKSFHENNNNEIPEQIQKYNLSDIAGLDKEISLLKEFFIQPFQYSSLYKQIGIFIFIFFLNFKTILLYKNKKVFN
jgi:ATP-dependent 26S proteasome regulatory subunit